MEQICNDLAMEQEELDAVVANLDEAGWETMTPSEGWDIKEQIRHLAYYENRAKLAASNQEAFKQWFEEMQQDPKKMTEYEQTTGKDLTGDGTLNWWREEIHALTRGSLPLPAAGQGRSGDPERRDRRGAPGSVGARRSVGTPGRERAGSVARSRMRLGQRHPLHRFRNSGRRQDHAPPDVD